MIVIIDISKTLKVEIKILEKSRLAFSSELPSFIKDGGVMTPNWIWKNLATCWKIKKMLDAGHWNRMIWKFGDVFFGMCCFWKEVVLFLNKDIPKIPPKEIGSFYHWIFLYFLFARLDILSCSLWKFSKSEFCTFPKLWASLQTEAWVWGPTAKGCSVILPCQARPWWSWRVVMQGLRWCYSRAFFGAVISLYVCVVATGPHKLGDWNAWTLQAWRRVSI